MVPRLYRQGDVLIGAVAAIPEGGKRVRSLVLAAGEATGHRHVVERARGVRLFAHGSHLFLDVDAERARVLHPEHAPIELPRGRYRVWKQREWHGDQIRDVVD